MNIILRNTLSLCLMAISVELMGQGLLPVTDGQLWGYINRTGKVVVPLQFDHAGMMYGRSALAFRKDSLFIVDNNGNIQSRGQCERYMVLDEQRGTSLKKGKWALTDSQGAPLTPFQFDHIRAADNIPGDYLFSMNGRSGIMNVAGNIIFGPVDAEILPVAGGLYRVVKMKKTKVINRNGIQPVQEQIFGIRHLGEGYFQATSNTRQTLFFHRDSGLILSEKSLGFEIFNDHFIGVTGSNPRLFNTKTGKWCDSVTGPFTPSDDNLMIVTFNGFRHILHPTLGIITGFMADQVEKSQNHYIVQYRGFRALTDSQLRLLTDITFPSITAVNDMFYIFRDATGKHALFHTGQKKFVTAFRFNNLIINSNSVKGYLPGNRLLLLDLDSNGLFTDSMLFSQVVSVTVSERTETISPADRWNNIPNRQNGLAVNTNTAGWFWSPDRNPLAPAGSGYYGLRVISAGSKTPVTAIKPIFSLIFPLRGGMTIAGTYTPLKTPILPVVNWDRNWSWEATRMMLINDSLAKIMGRIWNYIDPADFKGNEPDYRALGNGQFHLLSKTGHKILFRSGYISRREGSVRRICRGGKLTTKLPDRYSYAPLTDPFLSYTGYIKGGIRSRAVWLTQGEWAILTPDLRVVKPAGARQQKVVYIEPFLNGHARYFLEDGTCGVCDSSGADVVPAIYHLINILQDSVIVYQAYKFNDNKGVLERNGQQLIPPVYSAVRELGEAYELRKDRSTFLADTLGHIITLPPGSTLTEFNGGWGFIRYKAKYRIINLRGDINETFTCSRVRPFRNGVAQAFINNKWHLIDTTGLILAVLPYEDALGVTSRSAMFRQRNSVIITDFRGSVMARLKRTDQVEIIAPGVICALRRQRYILYHESGERLSKFPAKSKPVRTAGGIACFSGNEIHFYDSSGIILTFRNSNGLNKADLTAGKAKIVKNPSGFAEITFHPAQIYAATGDTGIGTRVKTAIPASIRLTNHHMVQAVQNDLFLGTGSMQSGYFSSSGELIIPAKAHNNGGFSGQTAIAKTEAGFGLLGSAGQWLKMPGAKQITKTSSNRFIITAGFEADFFDAGGGKLNSDPIIHLTQHGQDFRIASGNRTGWLTIRNGIIWLK